MDIAALSHLIQKWIDMHESFFFERRKNACSFAYTPNVSIVLNPRPNFLPPDMSSDSFKAGRLARACQSISRKAFFSRRDLAI